MSKELSPTNPCHNCQVEVAGQVRKASCCWNIDLNIPSHQEPLFSAKNTTMVRRMNDVWMGERSLIRITGPCPNLDLDSGMCQIEEIKPLACRDLEPLVSPDCVKTPNGRYSSNVTFFEEGR